MNYAVLRLVSAALVGAAVGGGITYRVLLSNTVNCLVEAPSASPSAFNEKPIPKQPFLPYNGKGF